jgi:hypothetical protein
MLSIIIIIIFLFLFFIQTGYGSKYKIIKFSHSRWSKLRFPEKAFVTISIFLILIFITRKIEKSEINSGNYSQDKPDSLKEKKDEKHDSAYYTYEILEDQTLPTLDNYFILLRVKENKRTLVEKAMLDIKKKICDAEGRKCNINAYDTKKAYEWDRLIEKEEMAIPLEKDYKTEMNKIESKYYVYVADHLIADISFNNGDYVSPYPYRDWRYKELGGQTPVK